MLVAGDKEMTALRSEVKDRERALHKWRMTVLQTQDTRSSSESLKSRLN